jgi:hypothetical protein
MADIAANPPLSAGARDYPATLELDAPLEVANWRPLVHWFLAIPHYLVLYALKVFSNVLTLIAFFFILFTKKFPEPMFNIIAMYYRYEWRVNTYVGFMRESYPPFTFETMHDDPGTDPAKLWIAHPTELNRWLPLVKVFLAIPHFIVLIVRIVALVFVGLAQLFIVLFTGRLNERMRAFSIGVHRYQFRVSSYVSLMRDEYPPFTIH